MSSLDPASIARTFQQVTRRLDAVDRATRMRPPPLSPSSGVNARDAEAWSVGTWEDPQTLLGGTAPVSCQTSVPPTGRLLVVATIGAGHIADATTTLRADIQLVGGGNVRQPSLPGLWAYTGGAGADPDGSLPGSTAVWKVYTGLKPTVGDDLTTVRLLFQQSDNSIAWQSQAGELTVAAWPL
jgi:hypothetical protein